MVKVKVKPLSRVRLFATPWTVDYQASLSMEFSRQEYWNGLPFPSPGDLPNTGIEPGSPALYSTRNHIQSTVINHNRKEYEVCVCVYIYISESLCCTPETNTVHQLYFKEKKKKKKNR